jgi:hypothetical protein
MHTDGKADGEGGTALLLQPWASPVLSPNIARDQCNIRPLGFDANDLRRSCSGLTLSEMRKHRVETSASVRSLAEVLILQAVRCSWNKQVSCQSSSSRVLRTLRGRDRAASPLAPCALGLEPHRREAAARPRRARDAPEGRCYAYRTASSLAAVEAKQLRLRLPIPICVHLCASVCICVHLCASVCICVHLCASVCICG